MTEALHAKYRPTMFKQLVGQAHVVKTLNQVIADDSSQAFLYHGPSGCGKTTLARIVSKKLGCDPINTNEVAGAVFTGVDAMRALEKSLLYAPFTESKVRSLIIDECHRLSKQAWDALLKLIEEPPEDVYIHLCTTEPTKVPKTIVTRCTMLALKPVVDRDLTKLLKDVMLQEDFKLADDILRIIVTQAQNSPRQALVYLAMCRDATSKKEAADRIQAAVSTDPIIALARFLLWQTGWESAMKHVEALKEENPESVRIVVTNYVAAVARGSYKPEEGDKSKPLKRTERDILHSLRILDAFSKPFNPTDGTAPLILAIGEVLLEQ